MSGSSDEPKLGDAPHHRTAGIFRTAQVTGRSPGQTGRLSQTEGDETDQQLKQDGILNVFGTVSET